jgi:hypothetical protein
MLYGPFKENSSLIYPSPPCHPGALFKNRILFKLEALNNWKMASYTGCNINNRSAGQAHTGRVVTIQIGPSIFPATRRRQEKGIPSPQKEYGSKWENQVSGPGDA